jgi:hypothetical protein
MLHLLLLLLLLLLLVLLEKVRNPPPVVVGVGNRSDSGAPHVPFTMSIAV